MKKVVPGYYHRFHCIADKCRHSCCIGWEIDIDGDTMAYYQSVPGDFGNRLRKNIAEEDGIHHFVLDHREHCPFLNGEGLCDVILTLGEDKICQICRDHPRFRNVFSDRVEIGLGLCCEEACRLILSEQEPMHLAETGECTENPTEEEAYFFDWRRQIFAVVQDRTKSADERAEELLAFCQIRLPEKTSAEWVGVYRGLTSLEDDWQVCLDTWENDPSSPDRYGREWDTAWEQLMMYFLYRHLPDGIEDGSLPERVGFAVLSFRIIREVCSAVSPDANRETLWEIARLYSSEVEYAEENVMALLDLLFDENNT
ncbi:MAG: flagellin lysine-N-methylase [Clostridia bacterium]|nr:flagellin lysine-N-methylase [Clostridia bacterium]